MDKNKKIDISRNQLLQLIPSGVGIYDFDGKTIRNEYLNDGYFRMIKSTRKDREKYGKDKVANAIHEKDLMKLIEDGKKAIGNDDIVETTIRVLNGENQYQWLSLKASHVSIGNGIERFYVSYYDVDELIKAQSRLVETEEVFNDIRLYSDISYFIYYPKLHQYKVAILAKSLDYVPDVMDDYPEAFIKFVNMDERDANEYRQMVKRIDNGAAEAECTVRFGNNGSYSWLHIHMSSVLGKDGKVDRAVGNAIIVDNYKKAEKALHDEKLRMEAMRSGILAASCFNVTKDRNVEINNDANLNYPKKINEEVYNEAVAAFPEIASQNKETVLILISAAEEIPNKEQRLNFINSCRHYGMLRLYESGKKEVTIEYRRRTGKGLIWVSTRIVVLPDPDSGDILAFYYTSDINDRVIYRKITGQILEKRYKNLAYYDFNSKLIYCSNNLKAEQLQFNGHKYNEVLDTFLLYQASVDEKKKVKRSLQINRVVKELEKNETYSVFFLTNQHSNEIKGNPLITMKLELFYLDENKDVIVFLQSDVTEIFEQERITRKKMAKALRDAQSSSLAKSEFVSRISHDIRTPISIISSMSEFATNDIDDKEKALEDLSKIKTANAFLLSLINDVLDISKIDSGKIHLNPQPYTYEEHTMNIKNVLETMCEQKGIKCVYKRLNENQKGTIVADIVRMNQITLNLISNAVKYTPPGGEVSYISISEDLPDAKTRFGFIVKDTGIGMSEDFQKRMFEPFTQEYENPNRPKGLTGTGLGLSIVKRMVDLMGGTISVKSELGKGTEIKCQIVFPDATRDPRYKDYKKQNDNEVLRDVKISGKVLIAEDNPVNMEITKRIIHSFGLESDGAENGAIALEKFKASGLHEYKAILMDIQMPIMGGYEATEKIRALKREDAATIPIIALTADAFADAMKRGIKSGMNDYMVKPLEPDKLKKVLISLLNE